MQTSASLRSKFLLPYPNFSKSALLRQKAIAGSLVSTTDTQCLQKSDHMILWTEWVLSCVIKPQCLQKASKEETKDQNCVRFSPLQTRIFENVPHAKWTLLSSNLVSIEWCSKTVMVMEICSPQWLPLIFVFCVQAPAVVGNLSVCLLSTWIVATHASELAFEGISNRISTPSRVDTHFCELIWHHVFFNFCKHWTSSVLGTQAKNWVLLALAHKTLPLLMDSASWHSFPCQATSFSVWVQGQIWFLSMNSQHQWHSWSHCFQFCQSCVVRCELCVPCCLLLKPTLLREFPGWLRDLIIVFGNGDVCVFPFVHCFGEHFLSYAMCRAR